jgi:hypothetical protein
VKTFDRCRSENARRGWRSFWGRKTGGILFNDHTDEDGAIVFRHACKLGLEGIVSKRLSKPYQSGRSGYWLKVKNPDCPAMIRARDHFARLGR